MASPAVIDLFKSQLDEELKKLAISGNHLNLKSGKPDPGMAFPHWYFQRIELKTREESAEIVYDGFEDKKIDAIDISDDGNIVRLFQFKNPSNKNAGFEDAAVDGILISIDLIIAKKRNKPKNQIEQKIEEIRSAIRTSYKIVFVSSGGGLSSAQKRKLDEKVCALNAGNDGPFTFEEIDLKRLQDLAYGKSLPTVKESIIWDVPANSYQARFGEHKSMVLHIAGTNLAKEYEKYGERLLQQNIRNSEGETSSNKDIYQTAVSSDSAKFYFYNNGISIICDDWEHDPFSQKVEIKQPQIVNGGQTIRQLHQARVDNKLKEDVQVVVRIISSGGDRQFAGNIAVYLNNQTTVRSSLLRSNHQFFIQMQQTLLTKGWYLERKPDDWRNLSDSEQADLIAKIGTEENIIPLQIGCQAYCAYYLQDISLAKKNPKEIFISKRNGGKFEDVITPEFTAPSMIEAYEAYLFVEMAKKELRKLSVEKAEKMRRLYKSEYGIEPITGADISGLLPQATLFIVGLLNNTYAKGASGFNKKFLGKVLVSMLKLKGRQSSWPTSLKNQTYFNSVKMNCIPTKRPPGRNSPIKKVKAVS